MYMIYEIYAHTYHKVIYSLTKKHIYVYIEKNVYISSNIPIDIYMYNHVHIVYIWKERERESLYSSTNSPRKVTQVKLT